MQQGSLSLATALFAALEHGIPLLIKMDMCCWIALLLPVPSEVGLIKDVGTSGIILVTALENPTPLLMSLLNCFCAVLV
jgi:hypothetical protein